MKKNILFLCVLLSASLACARTRNRDGGPSSEALLSHASQLDHYATLAFDELQASSDEINDLIGELTNALNSENNRVNPKTAQQILDKINAYKQAEREKVAASRRQIKK